MIVLARRRLVMQTGDAKWGGSGHYNQSNEDTRRSLFSNHNLQTSVKRGGGERRLRVVRWVLSVPPYSPHTTHPLALPPPLPS